MEIFKDNRLKLLIELIKDSTKNTIFENKVFLCGGSVRDGILGLPFKDVNICVELENGGITFSTFMAMKCGCFKNGSNPVIFEACSTSMLRLYNNDELKDVEIECVETRKEQYQDAICKPLFGTLEEDSKNRDLTINSIYYNISSGKLLDFNNGIDDLASETIKAPSDPDALFKNSPTSILRVIRFSTKFGWGIEKNTWLSMISNAYRIKDAPKEMVREEICKILLCEKPSIGIIKMYNCGILQKVMPDIYDTTFAYESKEQMITTFEHTMNVLDAVQPFLEHRLAALFHDVGRIITDKRNDVNPDAFSAEVASYDLREMRFSTRTIDSVETAIKYHRAFSGYQDGVIPSDKKIRKFMNATISNMAVTFDLMNANNIHCACGKKTKQVLDILNRIEEMEDAEKSENVTLPINGNDIMAEFNLKKGPTIGILLGEVKNACFENPNLTKDEAFEVVENKIRTLAV